MGRELRSSTTWPECLLKNLPPVSKDTCTQQREIYYEVQYTSVQDLHYTTDLAIECGTA